MRRGGDLASQRYLPVALRRDGPYRWSDSAFLASGFLPRTGAGSAPVAAALPHRPRPRRNRLRVRRHGPRSEIDDPEPLRRRRNRRRGADPRGSPRPHAFVNGNSCPSSTKRERRTICAQPSARGEVPGDISPPRSARSPGRSRGASRTVRRAAEGKIDLEPPVTGRETGENISLPFRLLSRVRVAEAPRMSPFQTPIACEGWPQPADRMPSPAAIEKQSRFIGNPFGIRRPKLQRSDRMAP